ncbi:endonuclease III [Nonomuraea bangladeshensis]|uniref:Endonuclease III n=1 Tax=Nonomuraea bangladeshensis TaxID=404385 RepID=A0ABV3HKG3_9ACTN
MTDRVMEVLRRLRAGREAFAPGPALPVVDQVVATVLSQATSDVNSGRAFARLKDRFPAWEQVADAPPEEIADAIRCGGIAERKARRIQEILAAIEDREGAITLDRLDGLDDEAAESYLTSLPGVGPKTAACVLMFSMGRAAFPVDTHVHRVTTRLGWIPPGTSAAEAHRLLRPMVPPEVRHELHIALIRHGRTVCQARRPRCEECVLREVCAYGSDPARRRSAPPDATAARPRGRRAG